MATNSDWPAILELKYIHGNKNHERKNHGHDKGNKSKEIVRNQLPGTQAGFDKIIRLFTGIDHHGNHRDSEHGEHKSGQEFLQYVPVQFFHAFEPAN